MIITNESTIFLIKTNIFNFLKCSFKCLDFLKEISLYFYPYIHYMDTGILFYFFISTNSKVINYVRFNDWKVSFLVEKNL
jgi:hypothetical protein